MKSLLKYYFLFVLTLILMIQGCEKPYSWDFKMVETGFIVVDGIITNELKVQCIRLSRPNPNLNDTIHPLSGAAIMVDDSLINSQEITV